MSDQQTPPRRSTRSSVASSPAASDISIPSSQQNRSTPASGRSRGSAPPTPTPAGMRTPVRGGGNAVEEDMDVDELPGSNDNGRAQPPSATRSMRSVSSRSSTNTLARSAQQNAGSRRRINIRADDDQSMVSGVVPFSPSGSAVSSLGLGSLSPASRNMSSPRNNTRGGSDILASPLNYGTPSCGTSGTGVATPHRVRTDIGSTSSGVREINTAAAGQQGPQLVIWGTDVSATAFKGDFEKFIRTYKEEAAEEDEATMDDFQANEPYYMQKLHEINLLEEPYLNLNCAHLKLFSEEIYRQLICYPQEVIPTMDMTINEIFNAVYPDTTLTQTIQIRTYNAEKTKAMRYLNPEDIDQLVTVHGMVIRTSNLMPEMREGFFKCSVCEYGARAEIDRGRILEPVLCPSCNTNFSFTLIHNRSTFVDKQLIRLQEDLEDTPVGETPYMATLFAHGEMVNLVQPGDRIAVTGIYRAAPFRLNPRMRTVRAVYKTHIDVVHYRKVDAKRLRDNQDGKGLHISPERVEFIKELAKKEDIYERLAKAIAPSIYEHEDVKKGLLLQLFGGTKKEFINTGRGRCRAEINILLCGDPGTSKSQLLKYIYDLVPRSQYTSGKGSSAVGLTAYITKDPETKQIVLQTGALVLADNGVCCIDEFDKMNESTRSVLHEVMEQQTLSIAKAGIICQLNARTSVLAAANPVESQWNQKKTIVENVHLPHTLLSRFDLIFLLLDPQSDTYDRRLARHMITLYFKSPEAEDADLLDMSVLRDYIAYAKEYIHPKLNDEASQRLIHAYVEMRKAGSGKGQITAYPRQLESLIRLSEAHAKIRLSDFVEIADVEEAFRLHREAVKQTATDPLTGKIDVSIITTGISSTARKRRLEIANAVKRILESKGRVGSVNQQKLLTELKENSNAMVSKEMFEDVLKELQDEGLIVIAGKNSVRLCHA